MAFLHTIICTIAPAYWCLRTSESLPCVNGGDAGGVNIDNSDAVPKLVDVGSMFKFDLRSSMSPMGWRGAGGSDLVYLLCCKDEWYKLEGGGSDLRA